MQKAAEAFRHIQAAWDDGDSYARVYVLVEAWIRIHGATFEGTPAAEEIAALRRRAAAGDDQMGIVADFLEEDPCRALREVLSKVGRVDEVTQRGLCC
jgi:uncharacterized heparinase superfamily protein